MVWRTYTIPGSKARLRVEGDGAGGKTWSGEWWKVGGGGTAWEGVVYDPSLDLLYFGTGNATAWYRDLRGKAKDDNLYAASILAVRASNGELAWYFQTVPGDNWDFDATQPLVQADLAIAGRPRKVIMQASKNGFFYVLDRQTGEFIPAPFVRRHHVGHRTRSEEPAGRSNRPRRRRLKPVIVSPRSRQRALLEPDCVQSRPASCIWRRRTARMACTRPTRSGNTTRRTPILGQMRGTRDRSSRN
jgi:hypothetical protein